MNMTQNHKLIRNKIWLLKLAEQLDNVSKACKILGFSRDSFYESTKGAKAESEQRRN